jgi:hypothetical protein
MTDTNVMRLAPRRCFCCDRARQNLVGKRQLGALAPPLLFCLLLVGERNLNHGVDAMTDTDIAVMPPARDVTRDDDDDPDPVELDRLDASLDDLRRHWGELDTVSR